MNKYSIYFLQLLLVATLAESLLPNYIYGRVLTKKKSILNLIHNKEQSDLLNVTSFGIIGDGTTDNTLKIQALLNTASIDKNKIYFPNGTYVTNQLVIPSFTKIVGQSMDKTILKLNSGTMNTNLLYVKGGMNISLSNITLDANRLNNTSINVYALYLLIDFAPNSTATYPINNINISKVLFKGGKGSGTLTAIGLNQPITNVHITNCKFDSSGKSSIQLRGCKNFTVEKSLFTNWGLDNPNVSAFNLISTLNDNIIVTNNLFKNTVGVQFAIECAGAETINSKFYGNYFYGNHLPACGISGAFNNTLFAKNKHLEGTGNWRSGYEIFGNDVIITDNFIDNGSITLFGGDQSGSYIGSFGNKFVVTNNIVNTSATNTSSLFIAGSLTHPVRNSLIKKNSFDNTGSKGGNSPTIYIGTYGNDYYADSLLLDNNNISASPLNACIYIRGADTLNNLTFTNNIFNGKIGLRVLNPNKLKNIKIVNNKFSKAIFTSSIFSFDKGSLTSEFKVEGNTNGASTKRNKKPHDANLQ